MGSAVTGPPCPPDARALRDLLDSIRDTADAVACGRAPGGADIAGSLDYLAEAVRGAAFGLGLEAVRSAARDAGQYAAGFIAGRSARTRVPHPRRAGRADLRVVPDGSKARLRALSGAAALAVLAAFVPHHAEPAAAVRAPVIPAAVPSHPSSVLRDISRSEIAARTRPGPGRDRT